MFPEHLQNISLPVCLYLSVCVSLSVCVCRRTCSPYWLSVPHSPPVLCTTSTQTTCPKTDSYPSAPSLTPAREQDYRHAIIRPTSTLCCTLQSFSIFIYILSPKTFVWIYIYICIYICDCVLVHKQVYSMYFCNKNGFCSLLRDAISSRRK